MDRGGRSAGVAPLVFIAPAALLILATIITISLGQGALGQFIGVALSGFTLLFVLHTSGARRRAFRTAASEPSDHDFAALLARLN